MPDDLIARKVEALQRSFESLPADLVRKLEQLDKFTKAQKEIQRQLDALGQQVTTYIEEDRAARTRQFALTALVGARAEHDRQFGHYRLVRCSTTGMLRVMTTGTVRPAALARAAEQLMVDACGYWLSAAQVALAGWVGNSPVRAQRAVLEAVSRDPGRSALFFGLVLARFGRPPAAARWIAEYAKAQDRDALTGEFAAVLDAAARGALGGLARECLLAVCLGWRDQIGTPGEREAKQVASWTGFIRGQRRPLTDKFHALETVSRDWVAKRGSLEAVAAFGHTEQWLKGLLGRTSEGDELLLAAVDDLLREVIAAPDQAEGALLEAAGRWQAIVDGGHSPTPAGGEPARTDFLTLSTAIATGTHAGELSEQATQFCLVLSAASVERAITDLSRQVRNTYPASIEVDIAGWHHAVEPGDDPDALVQKFLGWAHEAMIEDKAQATRKRLSMSRTPARLEHIESTWEARRQKGQETVYLATTQANLFFQKWQQGIAAAERCVDLLRAQPGGTWHDAQEPRTVPGPAGPAGPAGKLPDWEPRPPAPGPGGRPDGPA